MKKIILKTSAYLSLFLFLFATSCSKQDVESGSSNQNSTNFSDSYDLNRSSLTSSSDLSHQSKGCFSEDGFSLEKINGVVRGKSKITQDTNIPSLDIRGTGVLWIDGATLRSASMSLRSFAKIILTNGAKIRASSMITFEESTIAIYDDFRENENLEVSEQSIRTNLGKKMLSVSAWHNIGVNINLFNCTHIVSFETNGGTAIDDIRILEGKTLPSLTTTKYGHTLVNWHTDELLTTVFSLDTPISSNMTLYAEWAKTNYTATFNSNEGTRIETKEVFFGEKVNKPNNPTRAEYKFVGWYTDKELNEEFNFDTKIKQDITLYAKWEEQKLREIPDDNFRAYLKEEIPEAFEGDFFLKKSLLDLKIIDIQEKNIASLQGVQYFTALQNLDCSINNLTTLDVSKNIALTDLSIHYNQLTTLDVSKNIALQDLVSGANPLGTLDVSQNKALTQLYCYENNLTTLDVSQNRALIVLNCRGNKLKTLDLSQNPVLRILRCDDNNLTAINMSQNKESLKTIWCQTNQLSTLDVSQNKGLLQLYCWENQLSTLDVSQNPDLKWLLCNNNQLTTLDLSNNPALIDLRCQENKPLTTLDLRSSKNIETLNIKSNPKLAEISIHESKLCDAGIKTGGIRGVFNENKDRLDMRIKVYNDAGELIHDYDETAYEEACPES